MSLKILLSGHQPVYLPGIILFNKIALSDAFMFVGHCQLEHGSWQNRNQIRTGTLTVPLHHKFGQSIGETEVVDNNWRRKHLRSIEMAYGKRPFFAEHFPAIEGLINQKLHLGAMNVAIIIYLLKAFGITTPIYFSEKHEITGHKTQMLISMCKALEATEYLSNEGARDYVDEAEMLASGFRHRWQKFTHPIYDQGHREFMTDMSAIDLLFNCGPASGEIIRESGYAG